ncbi:MAG: tRNA pseudouridine(38-40) synthase TruA [Methanomassiliicoccaceae archaeon]|nr:tRNA pseudouridine(38-40) synthase TruA [Methanomassiliicoccaceae archaeon]
MRRVAVKIAYLGGKFKGSQIQPKMRTVEGDVVSDLKKLSYADENDIDMKCASRTDKGVNALGNVIVFNTIFDNDAVLLKALNAVSEDIFYIAAASVNNGFNPRHATERIYRYTLPRDGIDIDLATKCASLFVGEHDFAMFCKADERPTKMRMRSVEIKDAFDNLTIEFKAEYFLWNMIRRIVAAISSVGHGNASLDDVKKALNGSRISFGIARSDALTLVDVIYDHIEFTAAGQETLEQRKKEELFSLSLRKNFFDSL